MSTYNLSDNVQDDFKFELRGNKYAMRYPRTDEVEQVQEFSEKLKEAQDENRTDEVKELGEQLEAFLYSFIAPEGHETPIKEALAKENIKVMRNFNKMIKAELSIS